MQELHILNKLIINEIFSSAQGEGLRFGIPSIFIRFSGCSLKCSYCDTKGSWASGEKMTVREVVKEVEENQWSVKNVVITGGEPCEQHLEPLVVALKRRGYFLSLETSGTRSTAADFNWVTVSPKDVSGYFIHPSFNNRIDELKLVVNENLNKQVVTGLMKKWSGVPVLLQPNAADADKFRNCYNLYRELAESEPERIRLGMQLHRVYEIE